MSIMNVVNEQSSFSLTISFYDTSGSLAQPTSASYSVNDLTTGSTLLAQTALSPTGGVATVIIDQNANKMISPAQALETHVITVWAIYGANDQITEQYLYQVKNLDFVT